MSWKGKSLMAEANVAQVPVNNALPPSPPDLHYTTVVKAILDGRIVSRTLKVRGGIISQANRYLGGFCSSQRSFPPQIIQVLVVPFLGGGVKLCGRPPRIKWKHGQDQYLPSGGELSTYLVKEFDYPAKDRRNLLRVSQYIEVTTGSGPLYEKLHALFDANYPATSLHQFFALLPSVLREKGFPPRYQLIVTTNYDDVLERAFKEAGEPFDLVTYVAVGEQRGKFVHWPPGSSQARLIERPNEYRDLSLDQRTIILKIHG